MLRQLTEASGCLVLLKDLVHRSARLTFGSKEEMEGLTRQLIFALHLSPAALNHIVQAFPAKNNRFACFAVPGTAAQNAVSVATTPCFQAEEDGFLRVQFPGTMGSIRQMPIQQRKDYFCSAFPMTHPIRRTQASQRLQRLCKQHAATARKLLSSCSHFLSFLCTKLFACFTLFLQTLDACRASRKRVI